VQAIAISFNVQGQSQGQMGQALFDLLPHKMAAKSCQ